MAKRLTIAAQQNHSWAIYHIKATPAKLVGIIENAPDKKIAIEPPSKSTRFRRTSAAG